MDADGLENLMAGRWYILDETSTESGGSRNVLENCRKKLCEIC